MLAFFISYSHAVQNVFITFLMISYGTPDHFDSFIWVIPVIINYFIDPPIVSRTRETALYRRHTLALLTVLASVGAVLVGISTNMHRRALWCSAGWILMDVSLSLLQKLVDAEQSFGGAVGGYISAIALTNLFAYRSLKRVIRVTAWCYYVAAALGAVCLLAMRDVPISVASSPSKLNSWGRFSTNFLTDCVNIYAVVWCVGTFKRAGAYWGVQYGAAMLLGLLLLRRAGRLQDYHLYVQISLLLSCLSFFFHWNILTLGIMVVLVGLTAEAKGEEEWSEIGVARLELAGSIVVLSVMPAVELLLFRRDDVFTSVIWMAGSTVLTLTHRGLQGRTMPQVKAL